VNFIGLGRDRNMPMTDKLPALIFVIVGIVMVLLPVLLVNSVNKYQIGPNGKRILKKASESQRELITKRVITIQQIWTMFGGLLFIVFGLLAFFDILKWRN
jgi:hypothetical protein